MTFIIQISKNYTIQCFIEKDEIKKKIELEPRKEYYPLTIQFDGNDISYCQKKESNKNEITFMNDLMNNSFDYKEYTICYQGKEYNVIAEVLLALIINEFKKKIERNL